MLAGEVLEMAISIYAIAVVVWLPLSVADVKPAGCVWYQTTRFKDK